ncbi:MAG: hypothetical protein B1H11_06460 [Desulfobacteraceae bacterium 4484_190.1]|nr:MAG: hypothetical protein B1H11_06460 [Desulfobacteraceae bacterium 4484_190.1]
MKKYLVLGLFVLFSFTACSRESSYIKDVRRTSKNIILPETDRHPSFRPYVVNGEKYYPLPESDGFVQFGKASWYGKKFHGHTTSSGEKYNMYAKSAAHKTLPMGTYVRVLNLDNKKDIIVRINDRGPFVKGRIIDLSYAAARKIGLVNAGVVRVKIEALGKKVGEVKTKQGIKPVVEAEDLNTGVFTIQIGAFKNKNNAFMLLSRLKVIFDYVQVTTQHNKDEGTIYKVWVSKSNTLLKAEEIEKKLEAMGFEQAFIVSL